MKAPFLFFSAILLLAATACNREIDPTQKLKSTDLVVAGDFDWKTSQDLKVTVAGLPVPDDYVSTLKISDPAGNVVFTSSYNLRDNLEFSLMVPSNVLELTLTFGSRTIKSSIDAGKVDFTFAQKDNQADLGK